MSEKFKVKMCQFDTFGPLKNLHFPSSIFNFSKQKGGGRTEKRFIGFGPFFVGLSVKSSKFFGLSVKGKHSGVGD